MELPAEFDAIIVGTGITQTILAGALSKVEKKILHLDYNGYYGGAHGTHSLREFIKWLHDEGGDVGPSAIAAPGVEGTLYGTKDVPLIRDKRLTLGSAGVPACPEELLQKARSFNVDMSPRVLYSFGSVVDTLTSSGVHRYVEFKIVDGCYFVDAKPAAAVPLMEVPASKSDIFTNPGLSAVQDKRKLMKLVQSMTALNSEQDSEAGDRPFMDFLASHNLSDMLRNLVLYGVAMCDVTGPAAPTLSTKNGVKRCLDYMQSIGRFGTTPFIYPIYGTSELPQAFSRLSAVFGGIYVLEHGPVALVVEDTPAAPPADDTSSAPPPRIVGVRRPGRPDHTDLSGAREVGNDGGPESEMVPVCGPGEVVRAPHVVLGADVKTGAPRERDQCFWVSRCVCITDKSIVPGKSTVTAVVPPGGTGLFEGAVRVMQAGNNTGMAPEGKFVVQFVGLSTAEADLDALGRTVHYFWQQVAASYRSLPASAPADSAPDNGAEGGSDHQAPPTELWSVYFSHKTVHTTAVPQWGGVHICPDGDRALTFEESVGEARRIFADIMGPDVGFPFKEGAVFKDEEEEEDGPEHAEAEPAEPGYVASAAADAPTSGTGDS